MWTVAEYMTRVCRCGKPRSEHAHAWTQRGAEWADPSSRDPKDLHVVGMTVACEGFLDAIELELGGMPLANKHLRPLMIEGD
jgi:hypothetical protein